MLMRTGMPSAIQCTKELKGKNGKSCAVTTERCAGRSESQTAKALWAMKAAKDRKKEYYDTARKNNIVGRKQTTLELWEEHLKDTIIASDKRGEVLVESLLGLTFGSTRPQIHCWMPSIRDPASSDIISASVLLGDTAVCFLQTHEIDTYECDPICKSQKSNNNEFSTSFFKIFEKISLKICTNMISGSG